MNRQLRKWGEPPVLYSDRLTAISAEQIRLELNNRGYLNAKVDTFVVKENKKQMSLMMLPVMNPIAYFVIAMR